MLEFKIVFGAIIGACIGGAATIASHEVAWLLAGAGFGMMAGGMFAYLDGDFQTSGPTTFVEVDERARRDRMVIEEYRRKNIELDAQLAVLRELKARVEAQEAKRKVTPIYDVTPIGE